MVQIYGHRWLSAYGDVSKEGVMTETAKIWQKALGGVTYEQIAKGLTKCLESGNSWPPSLPEFRALCLGETAKYAKQPTQNAAAYRAPECLKLTKPRANREQARAHLQAMRKLIVGGPEVEVDAAQESRTDTIEVYAEDEEEIQASVQAQEPLKAPCPAPAENAAHVLYSDCASGKCAENILEPSDMAACGAQRTIVSKDVEEPSERLISAQGPTSAEEVQMPNAQAQALYSDVSMVESAQPCVEEEPPSSYTAAKHRPAQRKDTLPTPKSNLAPARGERSALAASKTWSKSWRVARGQGLKVPPTHAQPRAFIVQQPQPP